MGGRTVEGGEWGPLPMKANAKEASLAGRAGIQLISETRHEGEKALLGDEACVRGRVKHLNASLPQLRWLPAHLVFSL